MPASRTRRADVIRFEDPMLIMDFLYVTFSVAVGIILGKFFLIGDALEMVRFLEDENYLLLRLFVFFCLIYIVTYTAVFLHLRRHEIIIDIARECFRSGRNNVLQFRSNFYWLRVLLSVLQPSPLACMYIHNAFKTVSQLCLTLLASLIGSFLVLGKEIEFLFKNVMALGIYHAIAFSMDGYRVERVGAHLGYSLLHVGTVIYYFDYVEESYICINTGVAVFILCLVWYFVNVPVRRETGRRKRRP